jgi:hypothetical protein
LGGDTATPIFILRIVLHSAAAAELMAGPAINMPPASSNGAYQSFLIFMSSSPWFS